MKTGEIFALLLKESSKANGESTNYDLKEFNSFKNIIYLKTLIGNELKLLKPKESGKLNSDPDTSYLIFKNINDSEQEYLLRKSLPVMKLYPNKLIVKCENNESKEKYLEK